VGPFNRAPPVQNALSDHELNLAAERRRKRVRDRVRRVARDGRMASASASDDTNRIEIVLLEERGRGARAIEL
jgi:hypothetical protein